MTASQCQHLVLMVFRMHFLKHSRTSLGTGFSGPINTPLNLEISLAPPYLELLDVYLKARVEIGSNIGDHSLC